MSGTRPRHETAGIAPGAHEDTDSDEEMDEDADADNKKATKSRGKRKVKGAGVSEFLKPVKKGADPKSKKKK